MNNTKSKNRGQLVFQVTNVFQFLCKFFLIVYFKIKIAVIHIIASCGWDDVGLQMLCFLVYCSKEEILLVTKIREGNPWRISRSCHKISLTLFKFLGFESCFFFFFLMWAIFKVSIAFITILHLGFFFKCFLVVLAWGMWDLHTPTRDWTLTPCIEGKVLTTRPPGRSQSSLL